MEYIAVYFQLTDLNGVENFDFLENRDISAENDKMAVEKAQGIRATLELVERLNSRRHRSIKKVLLTSVRNQYNKRIIHLEGLH